MVNNVASSVTLPTTLPDNNQAASGKTLVHTPWGDVMADEQSQPDFYALFHPMTEQAAPAAQQTATGQSPTQSTTTQQAATQQSSPQPAGAQQGASIKDPAATPTLESVFGAQPWMSSPGGTGPNGEKWGYNPVYFATAATAEKVASLVGGTVIQKNDIITAGGGPFQQNAPNELIQFADGRTVNAGLIANEFNHGYSQAYIDAQIAAITDGEQI